MQFAKAVVLGCTLILFVSAAMNAQQPASSSTTTVVPRLLNFSGKAVDGGKVITGVAGATFAIYTEESGGAALWLETQNIQADAKGNYTVQLGVTKPEGLPLDLFVSGAARWLGVTINSGQEQPRVLLLSVPYALKAADAETIGGLPPSAFVLAPKLSAASGPTAGNSSGSAASSFAPGSSATITGGGKKDYVPLWLSSSKLGNSKLFQSTTGNIGIGTTTPGATLDVDGTINAASGFNLGGQPFAFGSYANENVFLGFGGNTTTTGNTNTVTGYKALSSDTTGSSNTANGYSALAKNNTGYSNTANGVNAMQANTAGFYNTASGQAALYDNTTGSSNTGFGINAGTTLDGSAGTGSGNTFLGAFAAMSTGSLSNATAIGANAEVTESNALVLGSIAGVNGATANTNVGIGTTTPGAGTTMAGGLTINGTGSTMLAVQNNGTNSFALNAGSSGQGWNLWDYATGGWTQGITQAGGNVGIGVAANSCCALDVFTGDAYAGYLYNNSSDYVTLQLYNDAPAPDDAFVFQASGQGVAWCNINIYGDLYCTGSKSAVVPVDGGSRQVALYAVEAPGNWFEDYGSGQLSNGSARIDLEPTFGQTVNTDLQYHVFLTPNGDCKGLYVSQKSPASFEVHELGGGTSNVAFDYRIIAKRKHYENVRLADFTERSKKLEKQLAGMRQHRAPAMSSASEPSAALGQKPGINSTNEKQAQMVPSSAALPHSSAK